MGFTGSHGFSFLFFMPLALMIPEAILIPKAILKESSAFRDKVFQMKRLMVQGLRVFLSP